MFEEFFVLHYFLLYISAQTNGLLFYTPQSGLIKVVSKYFVVA
jgi:hypothetical protein